MQVTFEQAAAMRALMLVSAAHGQSQQGTDVSNTLFELRTEMSYEMQRNMPNCWTMCFRLRLFLREFANVVCTVMSDKYAPKHAMPETPTTDPKRVVRLAEFDCDLGPSRQYSTIRYKSVNVAVAHRRRFGTKTGPLWVITDMNNVQISEITGQELNFDNAAKRIVRKWLGDKGAL